ncbi:MAG: phosphatase PAP2 family protein [Acidobacteriia bacterium]|nr:phosphatase PAP2 family protein [Terriglobia bacterium]
MTTSLDWGAKAVVVACGWIAIGLMVAEPVPCAAQPQPSEQQRGEQQSGGDNQDAAPAESNGKTKPVQTSSGAEPEPAGSLRLSVKEFGKDFVLDQKQIWTSPARLRFQDTEWLVPLSGITAGFLVTDAEVGRSISHDPKTLSDYNTFSNAGIGALVGGAAGMWLLSFPSHNQHWRETGLLAGEAALNSLIPVEVSKYALGRERPRQGNGDGHFFQGGTSFPSEHGAAAWAVAGVIGHEYPGPLPKLLAYGLASFVSYSRIRSAQHFPADVFVGGVLGSLIAQQVYSRHHDPELGGSEWRSIGQLLGDGRASPENRGSPYVPLDSWVYPALDRLAAFDLVDSGFVGMRPWTRRECARLLSEAEEHGADLDEENSQEQRLIAELEREFRPELEPTYESDGGAFRLESLYSRTEYISGLPIKDGYHFAQTQINDFGRPYGQGWNTINGFSAYSTWGRWVGYFRGEWQASAGLPALPVTARETIQRVDFLPQLPPDIGQPSANQFQVLDAYVGLMMSNWQLSFGRQSLWWGPGDGGPLIFSDNAAPLNMFRINRVTPFKLPSVLGWLGPLRLEFFLGQLGGQQFIQGPNGVSGSFQHTLHPQPMIHGERFTFKPTRNFEFGFSRTGLFAGEGVPFTLHTLGKSFFGLGNGNPGTPSDPGDRRSGMDWTYRLPKLRDRVTFYGDAFADDEISPIAYWDRSAIRGGLYFSRVPGVPKLDLRVEGVYTDLTAGGALSHGFFYFNDRFLNGYTSNGQLLASWIGREGQGAQVWARYWFSARNRLQFSYRHQKVSQQFIPGGGTLTDVGVRNDYWLRPSLGLSTWLQYERWLFPVIQPNSNRNVTAGIEVQFQPQKLFQRSAASAKWDLPATGGRP